MTIGTSMFSEFATRSFARVQEQIADLQTRISSGKNDPRSSADPMRAAQLSALTEQRAALEHFEKAAEQADSRIALTDLAVGDVGVIMRRMSELSLLAASDTLPPSSIQGLQAEAITLRESLMEIANRTDALGQPLFSGYSAGPAFEDTGDGFVYRGDLGQPSQRLSETLTLPVGLNGADLFEGVSFDGGKVSLFDMVSDVIDSFSPEMHVARSQFSVEGEALLDLRASHIPQDIGFTLTGPEGQVDISATIVSGLPAPLVDAINAQTDYTGVTAAISDDGRSIRLSSEAEIGLSAFSRSDGPKDVIGSIQQLAFRGQQKRDPVSLRTQDMSQDVTVAKLQAATDHFSTKRAEVGSMGAVVDTQSEALSNRRLRIDEAVSGLEDLDVADAVTRLQTLLMTRDAAQQTFVKISRTSLFDYLR